MGYWEGRRIDWKAKSATSKPPVAQGLAGLDLEATSPAVTHKIKYMFHCTLSEYPCVLLSITVFAHSVDEGDQQVLYVYYDIYF